MLTSSSLLDRCIRDAGGDFDAVIRSAVFDSSVIGACRKCGETSESHEPDATANHCLHCGANAVASVLILAGVI